jgi:hypothetical protein
MAEQEVANVVQLPAPQRGMNYQTPAQEVDKGFREVNNMNHYDKQGTNLQQETRKVLFFTLT